MTLGRGYKNLCVIERREAMETVARRFSNQFRTHWIGVKFYKEKPASKNISRPKGVRFCEVTKKAILGPVLGGLKIKMNCLTVVRINARPRKAP